MWTSEQLVRLAKLSDLYLDLPEEERGTWLAHVRKQHADISPAIDAMASSKARTSTSVGPALSGPHGSEEWSVAPGEQVGPYRLVAPLGKGGMSEVWLAEQTDGRVHRQVALKLIAPHLTNPGWRLRFERERDILANLSHPGIAPLIDAGFTPQGHAYLVMPVIEGETILQFVRQQAVSPKQCVEMVLRLLEAVAHAHERAIIHRDIKPSNVMVSQQGHVLLLDFGVAGLLPPEDAQAALPDAQLTALYGQAMTLDYASPEQVAGDAVGPASDVYAVGVLLFELLAGARPYTLKGHSRAALAEAILAQAMPKPSDCIASAWAERLGLSLPELAQQLQQGLDDIVLKALQRRPSERYASAKAFADDLGRWLQGQVVKAPVATTPPMAKADASPPTSPATAPPGPGKRIRDQIREHLIPTNTVIGLGMAAVTFADLFSPVLMPLAVGLRNVAVVFALCLVVAALWPSAVDRILLRVGLMSPSAGGKEVPIWRKKVLSTSLMLPVIFVAVALTGTLAMASSGGLIASQAPSLRSLQRQLLGLEQGVTTISRNVDKANVTLDAMAAREQAVQAHMAASPLSMGLLELQGVGPASARDGTWPVRLAVYLNAEGHSFSQAELHIVTTGTDGHHQTLNLTPMLGNASGPGAVQLLSNLPADARKIAACLRLPKASDGTQQMLIHRWRALPTADGLSPQAQGAPEIQKATTPACTV